MMRTSRAAALFLCAVLCGLVAATTADAQYAVGGDPAVGEDYHVEVQLGWWNPTPEVFVSSQSLGIIGSNIDFVNDLGIAKTRFREIRVVGRPARKHKFRFAYVPISYAADATLARSITFNGVRFNVNLPVSSSLTWKAYRFGYEYDFVYRDRGFVGLILEANYTDVNVELTSLVASEFARAKAPIPAIGGIGRVYVARNVALTGEITGFKLPQIGDEMNEGRYLDFDFYGTINFTNNVGASVGYRSLDVQYLIDNDSGDFKVKGWYFAGVVRF